MNFLHPAIQGHFFRRSRFWAYFTQYSTRTVAAENTQIFLLSFSLVLGYFSEAIVWSQCVRGEDSRGYLGLGLTYGTVSCRLYLAATGGSLLG